MASEVDHYPIITGRCKLAGECAIGAIVADLDLVFGIPFGVVADNKDNIEVLAHGCLEFGEVEAGGAVSHHRESGLVGPHRLGSDGIGRAGTNCARRAIDQ